MSVDNVFVIALLFSYFAVPTLYHHKVLFWGILGALVTRAAMIALGAKLITEFAWIIYIFDAFVILTGIKMIVKSEEKIHPERNPVVRLFKRFMPVTSEYRGDKFFIWGKGLLMATPLFVVLSFVGVKMLLAHSPWKIDTLVSLGVIVLAASVVASPVWPKKLKMIDPPSA